MFHLRGKAGFCRFIRTMKRKKGSDFLTNRDDYMKLNVILPAKLTGMLPAFTVHLSRPLSPLQEGTLDLMCRATLSGFKNPRKNNAAS